MEVKVLLLCVLLLVMVLVVVVVVVVLLRLVERGTATAGRNLRQNAGEIAEPAAAGAGRRICAVRAGVNGDAN